MRITLCMMFMYVTASLPVAGAAELGPATPSQREFAAAYALLTNLKVSVALAHATSGRYPPTYKEAKLDGPVKGTYFTIELGAEGALKITFNESAEPDLAEKEFTTVPKINESGDFVWHCFAPTIPTTVTQKRCL